MLNPKHSVTTAIIAGTISLCICWFFWYPVFGILFSLISFIAAIIATISGKKTKKYYTLNTESLNKDYFRKAKLGFNLGVAGIFISFICLIMAIIFTMFYRNLV